MVDGSTKDVEGVLDALTYALLPVKDLVLALGRPVTLRLDAETSGSTASPTATDTVTRLGLVNYVARSTGLPEFEIEGVGTGKRLELFDLLVADRIDACFKRFPNGCVSSAGLNDRANCRAPGDFTSVCTHSKITSSDDVPLNVYTVGERRKAPVVIVSACGMPARLSERWLYALEQRHFVATWETRWMFGGHSARDGIRTDSQAQVGDLVSVMDHLRLPRAHVMGICGGAVIALLAAATRPERVSSLSLWHGDYPLRWGCPRTTHQENLFATLSIAAANRETAASVRELVCDAATGTGAISWLPRDRAHLLLYPYATPELLYRYAQLTTAIASTNHGHLLRGLSTPSLVVTSESDQITHPAASGHVARLLKRATFHSTPNGDHISVFDATIASTDRLKEFLNHVQS